MSTSNLEEKTKVDHQLTFVVLTKLTATSSSFRTGKLRTLYRRRNSLFNGALIKRRLMCDGALK